MSGDLDEPAPARFAGCRLAWGDSDITARVTGGTSTCLPAGLHVLVVDVNVIVGLDVAFAMHEFGAARVTLADSHAEAIDLLDRIDIGFVVVDCDPGFPAGAGQRSLLQAIGTTPCMMVSVHPPAAAEGLGPAGVSVAHKPFTMESLRRSVQTAFSGTAALAAG